MQKFGEDEQASTRSNFASKSSKGKILRAVKNFNGSFITPKNVNDSRDNIMKTMKEALDVAKANKAEYEVKLATVRE